MMDGIVFIKKKIIIERRLKYKNMILNDFLKNRKEDIFLLWFDKFGNLKSLNIYKENYKNIPKKLLNMEYMESEKTNDCLEVWIK